ncbi:DUF6538 domain-containing protein [Xanthomonas euvesicatoria]|uniref:site-specific integrase n=2 Tax=Xanthomonas euvesicatoria TaxID=456327 RepID=UPI00057CA9D9|nr:site-specific integrase [Xanthomonas euvesicatoria]KHL67298.1 integrase [Xanthomonas euvesicatoria]KLB49866.1 integrase [Xanthomonas euvesicatoria]MCC8743098.1 site-specific integrase [Xanthomonas euvesicatoria pv. euvesicatoria]MCC8747361.1 site-specific integrase [Xanthomonas euvesicatoria pv. euvesicatoria]MCC8755736.1 site-specific integrase [Xanthomonas euvesicatoria pv. euvesicatoria]
MRLPTYLVRRSGGFSFRIIVPLRLRNTLRRKVIKHALHTTDPRLAQVKALYLAVRYQQAFMQIDGGGVTKSLEDLLKSAQTAFGEDQTRDYTLEVSSNGGLRVETDGTQADADNLAAALPMLLQLNEQARTQSAPSTLAPATLPPVSAVLGAPPGVKAITIAIAREKYIEVARKRLGKAKTFGRVVKTIDEFTAYIRPRSFVYAIQRHQIATFLEQELTKGLQRSTVNSTQIWLAGFFKWAMASGYFEDGRNPAHGHITITKKEKRKAAALGSEPFNIEQLKNIFDFNHFHDLGNERDRWVALICVYTGARSNEIAKMEVADIVQEEGVWVFDFNLLGEYKSTKSEASERKVTIHPDLIELGILERVERLKIAKEQYFFPDLTQAANNGPAGAPQRAFIRYIARRGIKPRMGQMGLHSFRDTVITQMTRHGVSQGWRERYVGHEQSEKPSTLDTAHSLNYSQNAYEQLSKQCHPALCWEQQGVLNIKKLKRHL